MNTNTQNIARKIFFLFSFLYFLNANAQAPNKFSFQAVVRNSSNQLVANQSVGVKISLISVVMGTENAEFEETHTVTTNANGLFSLKVGEGALVSGDFSAAMSSAAQSIKIKCEIDPTGGTNYTIISNEQLVSVPYALKANNATYANNADFATNATNATTATTATSVTGIHGTEGYVSVFGANNSIGSSILYEDSVAGNMGIYTTTPLADLDVAGNGTILARNRIVLGPVGGNPATEPVWAVDNYNNEFRIFKQPNIYNSGNTYFSIAPTGNVNMTNDLNVSGTTFTNRIIAGANSILGNHVAFSGSMIEKLTVLHLTGNSIIDYDISDTDRNIIVKHDDNIYGRYRINLPIDQTNGRVLDITLLFFSAEPIDVNRKFVEFTNLIPAKLMSNRTESYMAIGNGISLGHMENIDDGETHCISHFKLIFSSELNSWIVLSHNYSSSTTN
jgi:hypothetical protein